jgi:hypothetical protein
MEPLQVVIDANVWAHAANQRDPHFATSLELCEITPNADYLLCVDSGWTMDDSNSSRIGAEYRQWIKFGSPGFEAIIWLATHERIRLFNVVLPESERRRVNRLLPRNNHDRHYLRVTICTLNRLLVSHDYDDFTERVRTECARTLDVSVVAAHELLLLIRGQEDDRV